MRKGELTVILMVAIIPLGALEIYAISNCNKTGESNEQRSNKE